MKNTESRKAIDKILKDSGFLSHFSFDIRPYLRVVDYKKGEYITRDTDPLTRVLYLERGTAKLYGIHKNGRQSLINYFTPPAFFGVPELFEENKRPFPIVAQTECRFIEVDTSGCRDRLLKDALFLRFCCSMALKQNVTQNRKYMNLAAYPSKNNFAACILLLQSGGVLSLKYTELAEYLTISYRHLMQLIAEMCREGILERTPKGLRILDQNQLQSLADEIEERTAADPDSPF
ncbi:MAG TPA: cyclic nucleotide-binding domain-containing protein [Candidatus Lachnoclostridium stercorigallinarum]|uniref:Cyclic nucleotide-binding domain-containing protein n=1 Tax=Candidatus Lachnoclostridium stercorigallinarum TaxID=2838634 RepID=A0A9D2K614_9FIRM|nr:cyclic nucleotide-binding domain-containing protein [Candidatus Lachnoclostridium stercorigallinarum]